MRVPKRKWERKEFDKAVMDVAEIWAGAGYRISKVQSTLACGQDPVGTVIHTSFGVGHE